jgi:hypothetical protein
MTPADGSTDCQNKRVGSCYKEFEQPSQDAVVEACPSIFIHRLQTAYC